MYQALYRKWRPKTFSQVVGQDHITGTLQRQVAEGRTAHAYLFTGTRGTGKTTCARATGCRTLQVWEGYYRMTREYFSGITLADLMALPRGDDYVI